MTIKGTITQDLAKSTSPRDKKLVTAKKAPPPRAEKRAPAEGELWGAYATYNFDEWSGADGYGLSWNGCENNLTAFSTSASNKRIPLREAKTYGLVDSFYANNARCIGVYKFSIYPKGFHISAYNFSRMSGNKEEEVIAIIKKVERDRNPYEIDKFACNDR